MESIDELIKNLGNKKYVGCIIDKQLAILSGGDHYGIVNDLQEIIVLPEGENFDCFFATSLQDKKITFYLTKNTSILKHKYLEEFVEILLKNNIEIQWAYELNPKISEENTNEIMADLSNKKRNIIINTNKEEILGYHLSKKEIIDLLQKHFTIINNNSNLTKKEVLCVISNIVDLNNDDYFKELMPLEYKQLDENSIIYGELFIKENDNLANAIAKIYKRQKLIPYNLLKNFVSNTNFKEKTKK